MLNQTNHQLGAPAAAEAEAAVEAPMAAARQLLPFLATLAAGVLLAPDGAAGTAHNP